MPPHTETGAYAGRHQWPRSAECVVRTFPPFERTHLHTRQGDYVLTNESGMLVYGRVMPTRVPDVLRLHLAGAREALHAAIYAIVLDRAFAVRERE